MASLGHPILGDFFYGGEHQSESWVGASNDNDKILTCSAADRADRLLLHAGEMTIRQPHSGEKITFTAPCPFTIDPYG